MDMMGISHTQNLCWINMTGQKRLNVCTPILEEYEWANLLLYTGIMGLIYKKLKGGSAVENGYEARDLKTKVGQRSGMQVILWILGAWVWPRAVMSWKLAATCLDGGLAVCSLMETQARLFIDGNPSQTVGGWKPEPDCSLMETQARLFIGGNPSQTVHWWKPKPDYSLMETQASLFVDGNPSQTVHWWKPKPDQKMKTKRDREVDWGGDGGKTQWLLMLWYRSHLAGFACRIPTEGYLFRMRLLGVETELLQRLCVQPFFVGLVLSSVGVQDVLNSETPVPGLNSFVMKCSLELEV